MGSSCSRTIFRFAHVNQYDWVFIESFPKQEALLRLLEVFGFQQVDQKANGELVLAKPMRPSVADDGLEGIEFHRRFGPYFIDWNQPAFIVPIQPRFDSLLFPDQQEQGSLLAGEHAFGNAIRKAYLCHASTQQVRTGSILLFYRSEDKQALTTIGVVEDTLRSPDPDVVAAYVARRTVYSMKAIREMATKPILAIRFRHAKLIEPHIRLQDLTANGILLAAPMSIVSVPENGKAWLRTRVDR